MLKLVTRSVISELSKSVCYVKGHSWMYKDYSNWMKPNGDNYDFKATRTCKGCKRLEYLYDDWQKVEKKQNQFDVLNDSCFTKNLQ